MGQQLNGSQSQAGVDPYNFYQSIDPLAPQTLIPTTYSGLQNQIIARNAIETETAIPGFLVNLTIDKIEGSIQTTGNVIANIVTLPPNSFNFSSLGPQIQLGKASTSFSSALLRQTANPSTTIAEAHINVSNNTSAANSSSYCWIPITIPSDARTLSMDITFSGLSPSDTLSVGVNDMPLMMIQSQFMPDGIATNSGSLDISDWSGQSVDLFFGLLAGDTNNMDGTITVDNIQFQETPEPGSVSIILLSAACVTGRAKTGHLWARWPVLSRPAARNG
jgi:hypothetical protein